MSSPARSPASQLCTRAITPTQSAACQAFGLPELAAGIVRDLRQPDLVRLATLSRAFRLETERKLYRSPAVSHDEDCDDRLDKLVAALERRSDPAEVKVFSFGIGAYTDFPDGKLWEKLVVRMPELREVEIWGTGSQSFETIRVSFQSIFTQLTSLTLGYQDPTLDDASPITLPLLSACPNLRHLTPTNIELDDVSPQPPAPSYHLHTLTLDNCWQRWDAARLGWVIGSSADSLRAFATDDHALEAEAARALPGLAPGLREARFGGHLERGEGMEAIVGLARWEGLERLEVCLAYVGAEAKEEVMVLVAGLEEAHRAKVVLMFV